MPRSSTFILVHIAHNSKLEVHFTFSKTMSILTNFCWRHKARAVRIHVDWNFKISSLIIIIREFKHVLRRLRGQHEDGDHLRWTLSLLFEGQSTDFTQLRFQLRDFHEGCISLERIIRTQLLIFMAFLSKAFLSTLIYMTVSHHISILRFVSSFVTHCWNKLEPC